MRKISIFVSVILFLGISFCLAQEEITITTYYPSPFGVYQDLEVHNDLTFKDPGGSGTDLEIKTDGGGNLHLNVPGLTNYHIIFDDVNRPFCYLLAFALGPPTNCANGYVSAGLLDVLKKPVDPSALPPSGFIVCIRGW